MRSLSYVRYRPVAVVIRLVLEYRLILKVVEHRRRGRFPLQRGAAPRIIGSERSGLERCQQINRREEQASAQPPASISEKRVNGLELIEVVEVAPRHSLPAHDELRAERHVKADKDQRARK